jgi:hypothetical protein
MHAIVGQNSRFAFSPKYVRTAFDDRDGVVGSWQRCGGYARQVRFYGQCRMSYAFYEGGSALQQVLSCVQRPSSGGLHDLEVCRKVRKLWVLTSSERSSQE